MVFLRVSISDLKSSSVRGWRTLSEAERFLAGQDRILVHNTGGKEGGPPGTAASRPISAPRRALLACNNQFDVDNEL